MTVKGFFEGGVASIVAGCSTHPLDLIKVRMQLQETHILRPAFALHAPTPVPPPPPSGPISVGVRIVQAEGVAALFSGVSATMLRQTLYSTTRMGLYDVLKRHWTDPEPVSYTHLDVYKRQ
ncbi:solute carrier family 25 [Vigna unguiculata]|uniref:Solute carrier family 25 n=1 Tax=Vigna unguiculata TaxID=3917 RepID=A0A4D6NQ02_VIGUN|nr:solute carrier family 25 [Vigna unguiculata]